jgi:hypothetical protein
MNVDKTFKEIINDMRDDQDIYPKRGLSTEECSAKLLYDSLITFKNILNQSKSWDVQKDEVIRRFEVLYLIIEEKFDTIEGMLKVCNIEHWERVNQESKEGAETSKFKEPLILT